jgi:hypothetical protein
MKEEGRERRWGKRKGVKEGGWSTSCRVCTQTTSINKTRGTGSISTFRHSREKKRKQRSQGDRTSTQKTKYPTTHEMTQIVKVKTKRNNFNTYIQ